MYSRGAIGEAHEAKKLVGSMTYRILRLSESRDHLYCPPSSASKSWVQQNLQSSTSIANIWTITTYISFAKTTLYSAMLLAYRRPKRLGYPNSVCTRRIISKVEARETTGAMHCTLQH